MVLTQEALQSQSWPIKSRSATAMETIANKLKENLKSPQLDIIVEALINGLGGRTWKGKVSYAVELGETKVYSREGSQYYRGVRCRPIIEVLSVGPP